MLHNRIAFGLFSLALLAIGCAAIAYIFPIYYSLTVPAHPFGTLLVIGTPILCTFTGFIGIIASLLVRDL